MSEYVQIATPDEIELEFQVAGLSSRLVAAMIDIILFVGTWIVIFFSIGAYADFFKSTWESWSYLGFALITLTIFLSFWGYGIFWEQVLAGQTPGKKGMKLRVICINGLPVGIQQSLIRNLLLIVDLQPGFMFFMGIVSILRSPLSQRVGDIVAGTIVVKETLIEEQSLNAGALWAVLAQDGKSASAIKLEGGVLTAKELSLIESFLERAASLSEKRRQELAIKISEPFVARLGSDQKKMRKKDAYALLERLNQQAYKSDRSQLSTETPAQNLLAQSKRLF